jgi:hypothetical protein
VGSIIDGCVIWEESWSIETAGIFGRGTRPWSGNNERVHSDSV